MILKIPDNALERCFVKFRTYLVPFCYDKLTPDSPGFKELDRMIADKLKHVSKNFLRYQDKNGQNAGMLLAQRSLEECVLVCLNDPVASTQQDNLGMNIGMWSANSKLKRATNKAMENSEAAAQTNNNGYTIETIARKSRIRLKK